MKKLLLILAVTLFSCSTDEQTQPEGTLVDNCGAIEYKTYIVMEDCYKIAVKSYYSDSTFNRCLDLEEWQDLEVGDTYCYGQTTVYE